MKCLVFVLALVVLVAMVTVESAPSSCQLPAVSGMCKGYFPRFHFSLKSGKCESFVYGGCGGNDNNFKTVQECVELCGNGASNNILGG